MQAPISAQPINFNVNNTLVSRFLDEVPDRNSHHSSFYNKVARPNAEQNQRLLSRKYILISLHEYTLPQPFQFFVALPEIPTLP